MEIPTHLNLSLDEVQQCIADHLMPLADDPTVGYTIERRSILANAFLNFNKAVRLKGTLVLAMPPVSLQDFRHALVQYDDPLPPESWLAAQAPMEEAISIPPKAAPEFAEPQSWEGITRAAALIDSIPEEGDTKDKWGLEPDQVAAVIAVLEGLATNGFHLSLIKYVKKHTYLTNRQAMAIVTKSLSDSDCRHWTEQEDMGIALLDMMSKREEIR